MESEISLLLVGVVDEARIYGEAGFLDRDISIFSVSLLLKGQRQLHPADADEDVQDFNMGKAI